VPIFSALNFLLKMHNPALDRLRNWITADSPFVAALAVLFVVVMAGVLVGALFGGLGAIVAVGLLGALAIGVLMLRSTQAGLVALIALITLLPYGALPFRIGFRPTFIDVALLALFGVWALRLITGRQHTFVTSPLGPLVIAFIGWAGFILILGCVTPAST
jgi:hypothetical protein